MTEYFVDTENVGNAWFMCLETAKVNDKFVLFYTDMSAHIPLDFLRLINEKKCRLEYIKCCTGENALDFQLVAELGKRTTELPAHKFVVVSRDKGFSYAVDYLVENGANITQYFVPPITTQQCCDTIAKNLETSLGVRPKEAEPVLPAAIPAKNPVALPANACKETYIKMMPDYFDDKQKREIADILLATMAKTEDRENLTMRKLRDKYGHSESLRIFNLLKFMIADIDKNGPYPRKK